MRVNIRGGAVASDLRINVDTLPAEHKYKGSRGLGVVLAVFSLFWGGMPAFFLISSIKNGKLDPGMWFVLIFPVIGTVLFFAGIAMLFRSKAIRIDRDSVTFNQRGIFGVKTWTEPLKRYRGVLSREEYHSGGEDSPSYTLYVVELVHDEKSKVVQLYSSRSLAGHRAIWEDYCRKLNMSAVEKDGDGYIVRQVEDLDKSVRELIKEGKIEVAFDPSKNIPEELEVTPDGSTLVLDVCKQKSSAAGAIIGLLVGVGLPAIFIYIGFFAEDGPLLFGIVGIVLLLVVTAVILVTKMTRERIRVSVNQVSTCRASRWGEMFKQSIMTSEVESVKIYKKDGRTSEAVWLAGDNASISIGDGLKREALEWLRNCVLKVLSS